MTPLRLSATLALLFAVAGCLGGKPPTADPGATIEEPAHLEPIMEMVPGEVVLSANTPLRTVNAFGAFNYPLKNGPNVTGYVLELTWTPATAASERLSLWVRPQTDSADPQNSLNPPAPILRESGVGKLRVPLPIDKLPAGGPYEVVVRAGGEPLGVALNQPFELHVMTFDGLPFDPDHMMGGEHHEH